MNDLLTNMEFPEIFIGFVAPIGVDLDETISAFEAYFSSCDYDVVKIRITDHFEEYADLIPPIEKLSNSSFEKRYQTHIAYGNQLRRKFNDNAILASAAIFEIVSNRDEIKRKRKKDRRKIDDFTKTVYLIRQFKRQEEVELFRSVYRENFFQVSVYSRRGARVDYLSRRIAESRGSANITDFRSMAEELVSIDENERDKFGQKVGKIFHDADLIINSDIAEPEVSSQVERFCELLFSSNVISPSKLEYGMFAAKAAALRTLDLSRQVGAAIFSANGEIICLGSNEVPKALGGTYWESDGKIDDRDYKRKKDTNYIRKVEIVREVLKAILPNENIEELVKSKKVQDLQIMDALEYGRIIHAEMAAISDAARLGRELKDSILYCTTFPCHMCARHIVSSGIKKVYFLEPYPKSLSVNLHTDSISFEGEDRGEYSEYPMVEFLHFYGVTPRRYRELFERSKRKNDDGILESYINNHKRPNINIKTPNYSEYEVFILNNLRAAWKTIRNAEV
ncbi:dCMP deaminase [Rhizobiales bacterium]|uniref:anti-phage dCTP deaminase n=1 Tax=Hongsoonwoonella zoysiae TaxID=2821844 RepID=UPI0015608CE3|nr:anti-phage dCTP deaminase [Hongsoonwoonella zoysiae]NRG17690.1 dCMP deaminase [Hongsoonwoonella zoysiae]